MRAIVLAFSFLGALVFPEKVEALDCPLPPNIWSHPVDGDEISREQQLRDAEDRLNLYRLEHAPIIFRGRVASTRYLSDIRKTSIPISLLVFDHVEILKGGLFTTSKDRKAFVISEKWCEYSCIGKPSMVAWPPGKIVVMAAYPNDFADPSKAVEFNSRRVVYRGRIDAVLGMCAGGPLSDRAVEILNNPGEMARLKREFAPRRDD
ncbi:hypothetical protein QCM80_12375 [Bradyrhizobium sp. SSUT112]|uniref:hypothetical protein n=1 Tax=Bradyrhizobium sp. SSUT112 TaxID=3040604 RepID=UPI002448456D|nr:hypothetical protein [Bradyrhizobium sp. SSUT112]MDH2351461.1 hypothetical protein [Bradyrhizobium sp. SSUT112]